MCRICIEKVVGGKGGVTMGQFKVKGRPNPITSSFF